MPIHLDDEEVEMSLLVHNAQAGNNSRSPIKDGSSRVMDQPFQVSWS
jgi:hypothetical protein